MSESTDEMPDVSETPEVEVSERNGQLSDLLGAVLDLRGSVDAEQEARRQQTEAIDRQIKAEKVNTAALLKAEKERSNRQRNWMMCVIAMVSVLALIGWLDSRHKTDLLRNQAAQQTADRLDARIGSCNQDNVRIDQQNLLVDAVASQHQAAFAIQTEINTILELTIQPRPTETSAETQGRIEFSALVAKLRSQVDAALVDAATSIAPTRVERRVCTAAGTDEYLKGVVATTSTSTTTTTTPASSASG